VDPACRSRGIGAALLEAAEAWSRGLGVTELASDSDLANALGEHAHRALGFEEVGRVVQFRKPLASAAAGGREAPAPGRSVEAAFDAIAGEYDVWVRQAIPAYDELFRVATELVRFPRHQPLRFADLGAGSGLFAARILEAFPAAVGTLYDAASGMLEVAKARFASRPGQITLVRQRLEEFDEPARFDLIVSSLAIHHLEHAEKRRLFARVHAALEPGGEFVLVDQVRSEPPFGERYVSDWLARVRRAGAPEERIQASIRRRREFDRDASLEEQLAWLQEAGFAADCGYKHTFVALFLALKPTPSGSLETAADRGNR
jgi:tRNA (cmo5U34)-methyltransferase